MIKNIFFVFACVLSVNVMAQQVTNFSLVNVINNQAVSPSVYPSCAGMIIIFSTNNCPYNEYYVSRINKLAQAYQDRVPVLLVNPSIEPIDSKENMTKKARELNLSVPYLADKDQTLMANLEARKSPEAFLLKNEGSRFTVVYRGAIDDNAQVEADVRHSYLRDAVDIMLSNQKIQTFEVRPVGCNLKKK